MRQFWHIFLFGSPLSELEYPEPENQRVKEVIRGFSAARLLVEGRRDTEGDPYVEPAHDALVWGWQKLLAWKQDKHQQENLVLQRQLAVVAMDWKNQQPENFYWDSNPQNWWQQLVKKDQQKGLLWSRNPRLAFLKQVLNSPTDNWLNKIEVEFVRKSLRHQVQNRISLLGVGILVSTGALFIGFNRWNQNQQNQIINLVEDSKRKFESNQQLEALVVALQAGKKIQLPVIADTKTKITVIQSLQSILYSIKEFNKFKKHSSTVTAMNYCNDGKTFASVSDFSTGTINLWGIDGKLIKSSQKLNTEVISAAFNRDCKKIVVGSRDGKIELRNIDGNLIKTFLGHKFDEVTSVSLNSDAKILASGTDKGIITLWNVENGKQFWSLQGHSKEENGEGNPKGSVVSIKFSPDGNLLASSGRWEGTIKLWSLDGKKIATIKDKNDRNRFSSFGFSPDGKLIVSGSRDGIVSVWKLDGKLVQKKKNDSKSFSGAMINTLEFTPDGKTIAFSDRDGNIKIWNLDDTEISTIKEHTSDVKSLSFSLDGKTLAGGTSNGNITVWNLVSGQPTIKFDRRHVKISFSPDNKSVAIGGFKFITFWSLDGKQLKKLEVPSSPPSLEHTNDVDSVSFSSDGKVLAAAANGIIQLWNVEKDELIWKIPSNGINSSSSYRSISFSPDGKTLATPVSSGELELLNLDGKTRLLLKGSYVHYGEEFSFSPDSKILAALSDKDNIIKLWSTQNGKELPSFTVDAEELHGVTFSPNGKVLAANSGGNIYIWNLETRKVLQTINSGRVNSISFNHDSKILISGGSDIKLWNIENGELFATLPFYASIVRYSPDGKILASINNGTVTLWNLDLEDLLRRGCSWGRDYLKHSPNVSASDRHLCDDVNPDFF